jgi:hypothetical protein
MPVELEKIPLRDSYMGLTVPKPIRPALPLEQPPTKTTTTILGKEWTGKGLWELFCYWLKDEEAKTKEFETLVASLKTITDKQKRSEIWQKIECMIALGHDPSEFRTGYNEIILALEKGAQNPELASDLQKMLQFGYIPVPLQSLS